MRSSVRRAANAMVLCAGLASVTAVGFVAGFATPAGAPGFTIVVKGHGKSFPDATIEELYRAQLIVSGARPPVTFRIVKGKLPPGLKLDSKTGVIHGIPADNTDGLTYAFTV